MRKIYLLLLVAVSVLCSCENVQDNRDAMQGQIDDRFFRAPDAYAQTNTDGSFSIIGNSPDQKITLSLEDSAFKTHVLGGIPQNFATVEDSNGNVYRTQNGIEAGEVTITRRCISCGIISGEFNFTAIQAGVDTIRVSKGFFFDVRIEDAIDDPDDPTVVTNSLTAIVDGGAFTASQIVGQEVGDEIVITGTLDGREILIAMPSDVSFGNYDLPQAGFTAFYTDASGNAQEAVTGRVTVNFNNVALRSTKILFRFDTANHTITDGDARVSY